jgi:hypothetical protein
LRNFIGRDHSRAVLSDTTLTYLGLSSIKPPRDAAKYRQLIIISTVLFGKTFFSLPTYVQFLTTFFSFFPKTPWW